MTHRMPPRLILACLVALALMPMACSEAPPEQPAAPNEPPLPVIAGPRTVVLISLDTMRPDRLGVYGNLGGPVEVSPNIDAFAAEATVFDQALASAPWTLPSHMTMLTGLDPVAHGIKNADYTLSDNATTLAEALDDDGFHTGAFTDGGYVMGKYGFDRGFDEFHDKRDLDGGPNGFVRLLPRALDWLRAQQPQDDVFLFLHTFDSHAPYQESDPESLARFRERPTPDGLRDWGLTQTSFLHQQAKMGMGNYRRMAELLNDYDAGVNDADRGVAQVLDLLREIGRYENALIIVTSDHGESFFDHGLHIGHGIGLKDDELKIPLIVRFPRGAGAGTRRDELVSLVDIPRTALTVTGVEAPDLMQGESLQRLVDGRPRVLDYVLCASQNSQSWALVQNGYKYISPVSIVPMRIAQNHLGPQSPPSTQPSETDETYSLGPPKNKVELVYDTLGDPLGLRDVLPSTEQLYDRATDPEERRDLARSKHPVLPQMRKLFEGHLKRSSKLSAEFKPETGSSSDANQLRMLQALGYLGSGSDKDLRAIPPGMRAWVRNPWRAPDVGLLVEGDRLLQRVRAHMADGLQPTPGDKRTLEKAGARYARWYARNPAFVARVDWRLTALTELARLDGFKLNTSSWGAELKPLMNKQGDDVASEPSTTTSDATDDEGADMKSPASDQR
jgi:arylsulfatase A-like enzyme